MRYVTAHTVCTSRYSNVGERESLLYVYLTSSESTHLCQFIEAVNNAGSLIIAVSQAGRHILVDRMSCRQPLLQGPQARPSRLSFSGRISKAVLTTRSSTHSRPSAEVVRQCRNRESFTWRRRTHTHSDTQYHTAATLVPVSFAIRPTCRPPLCSHLMINIRIRRKQLQQRALCSSSSSSSLSLSLWRYVITDVIHYAKGRAKGPGPSTASCLKICQKAPQFSGFPMAFTC